MFSLAYRKLSCAFQTEIPSFLVSIFSSFINICYAARDDGKGSHKMQGSRDSGAGTATRGQSPLHD